MESLYPIIPRTLDLITHFLADNEIISHLHGLGYFQFSLSAIDILFFTGNRPRILPPVLSLQNLEALSKVLHEWKELHRENLLWQIDLMSSLNVAHSFERILTSIIGIVTRLIAQLASLTESRCRNSSLVILSGILQQIVETRSTIINKYSILASCAVSSEGFFFTTILADDETIMLTNEYRILLLFISCLNLPTPILLKSVNSPMMDKVKQAPMANVIANSTDPICQICHTDLKEVGAICFLVHCNHICCRDCMVKWFNKLLLSNRPM